MGQCGPRVGGVTRREQATFCPGPWAEGGQQGFLTLSPLHSDADLLVRVRTPPLPARPWHSNGKKGPHTRHTHGSRAAVTWPRCESLKLSSVYKIDN